MYDWWLNHRFLKPQPPRRSSGPWIHTVVVLQHCNLIDLTSLQDLNTNKPPFVGATT
ncbi:hypothetical protein Hanom_Chr00s079388g01793021 [Helianthus anomalus]